MESKSLSEHTEKQNWFNLLPIMSEEQVNKLDDILTREKQKLEEIKQKCLKCEKCPLCKTRTNTVFSAGIPNTKLMLIGEAPGYNEDMQGKPFVGKAGQLLDKIFASVGLTREKDVYICNTIKCRPPENRVPTDFEKRLFSSFRFKSSIVQIKSATWNNL